MRIHEILPDIVAKLGQKNKLDPEDKQMIQQQLAGIWNQNGPKLVDDLLNNRIGDQTFFQALGITFNTPNQPPPASPPKQEPAATQAKPEGWGQAAKAASGGKSQSKRNPKRFPTAKKGKQAKKSSSLKGKLSDLIPDFGAMFTGKNKFIAIGVALLLAASISYFAYASFTGPTSDSEFIFSFDEIPDNNSSGDSSSDNNPFSDSSSDNNPFGEEPKVELPPAAPSKKDAVDAGSSPWKGDSQWMQIALLVSCVLILIIDTGQKRRQIKDDTKRGSSEKIRLKLIWWAPSLVILGTLFLVKTHWTAIDIMLLDSGWKLALVYATICFFFAWLLMDGDSSYPAIGLTLTALGYLLAPVKTGALISAFKIPPDAVMYNVQGTINLITLNQFDQATFGILILTMFIIALVLVGIDLAKDTNQGDPMTFAGIAIAIIGGVIIFAAGRWIDPVWSFLLFLLTAFIGQAVTVEKFDEGLLGAIILGSILTLGWPLM